MSSLNHMNNKELQASRKLLFLEVSEAAEHIWQVSEQMWQQWESGEASIPDDVITEMMVLAQQHSNMMIAIDEIIQDSLPEQIEIAYYYTYAEYKADNPNATYTDWRISQSVASYYFLEGSAVLA